MAVSSSSRPSLRKQVCGVTNASLARGEVEPSLRPWLGSRLDPRRVAVGDRWGRPSDRRPPKGTWQIKLSTSSWPAKALGEVNLSRPH
jgi:hypothetical protein